MLQFVLGRAGSGKTEYLRELLAEKNRQGGEKLMMLVPEQYSFETEKAILHKAGPVRAASIQVYSFTRLAEAVFREEGGFAGRRLTDGGRRILMSSAIAASEDHLEVYAGAARSGRISDLMLTAVNEMKLCAISPKQLAETAEMIGGRGLGKKLSELALIYGAYEALVEASYLDSRDDLTRLADRLETSDFFEGATVAVDSFEGFTAQEIRVLEQILRRAETVLFSLCTDGLPEDGTGLFALVNRTRYRLQRLAEEHGVRELPPVLLTGAPRFRNENLKLLEAQLFCASEMLMSEDAQGIHVFSAKDVFEESEYVAATIRRLVESGGYRYRDFSVICRMPERYFGYLDVALQKREIPCFVSEPARVDAEPVMRFVLGAFEAVQSGFATDPLLEMLKTGVSGFSAEEISQLENYAFLWKVKGGAWREEFVRHPRGFGQEFTEEDQETLNRLNQLRLRLIQPLSRFAARIRDASGEEISEAVFSLLEAFQMEKNLPAYCAELEAAGENSLAAKQLRVWELLMEVLDQMHSILGRRKVARERYYSLLKEVIAGEDVSEIPQTVDEVIFGTPEQVRQSAPKIVFLIGAVQGEFPLVPKSTGVFSDAERKELIAMELPLGDPLEQKTIEERYLAYSVSCAASERLYVSYPRSADGEDREQSELVSAVLSIFPALQVERGLPDEYFVNSKEAAFTRMAARFRENTPEAAALRQLFAGDPQYQGRLEALRRAAAGRPARLEDSALAAGLFSSAPYLSATQIETYYDCKFKYFCRYGINAKERRPAEVDVMQYGTLMHYLFEKVFSEPVEIRESRSEKELRQLVDSLIQEYADISLGGFSMLAGREKYRLRRMGRSAVLLILHVEEELKQCRFRPEHFELGLGHGSGYPALKVETESGRTVTVGGTIDRVDAYHRSEGTYVRVVDYKTGKKEFRLSDVLHGLNMQMLVYLAALVENGQVLPAGILYMPAAEPSVSAQKGMDEAAVKKEADKQLRMSGMVLSDAEIITAMEDGAKGKFIPAALNKDGAPTRTSMVLTKEELTRVLEYSKRLIAAMAEELCQGNVEALPNLKNKSACRYCPYGAVCAKEYGEQDVQKEKLSKDEVLTEMTRVLQASVPQDGEGDENDGSQLD